MRKTQLPVQGMSSDKLLRSEAFRLGFAASNRKFFEPEAFYSDENDLWNYERGFHFATVLRTRGILLRTLPKKPTESLKIALRIAVNRKEII
jgi:hypothetical protein